MRYPMHDPSFTTDSLRGAMLIQIAVGEHQVQLHWDNDISMYCDGEIELTNAAGMKQTIAYGRQACPLLQCLGDRAKAMVFKESEYVQIDLEKGVSVRLLVSGSGFECFQIKSADEYVLIW